MTCSARLPIYVLLIGLLVDPGARLGPIGVQGLILFALYLLGALSAMLAAWAFSKIRRGPIRAPPAVLYGDAPVPAPVRPIHCPAGLVFFLYALQCVSTIGVLRRESGTWRWPAVAYGYLFALAWIPAFAAKTVAGALT